MSSLPNDNENDRYETFKAMMRKEPEISAIIKDVDLPDDETEADRFFRDLNKNLDMCDELACKIREKFRVGIHITLRRLKIIN